MNVLIVLGRIFVMPIFSLIYPSKRHGNKIKRTKGATIVIANHVSNCDVFLTAKLFLGKTYFLAKKEVFKNKFFGWILKSIGGLKISRDNPSIPEIKNCLEKLKEGKRLMIFPEGTRNKQDDGNVLPIKSGAGLFAFKAKTPIIPFYIDKKSKLFIRNHIYVGEPFTLEEFYDKKFGEVNDLINEKMRQKILECKKLLEIELKRTGKG